MNYSTAVFLINQSIRAVRGVYEDPRENPGVKRELFKTMDPDIKVDDLVVVPVNTRHKFTVVKVVEVDTDFDPDSPEECRWIVTRIDVEEHRDILAQEQKAITAIKSAEIRKKREDLKRNLFADHIATLKGLEIAQIENGNGKHEPE